MNILEVAQGLKQGKIYQLPGWGRLYIYLVGNTVYLKSIHTEGILYSLHISELESNEWIETNEEELKNVRG